MTAATEKVYDEVTRLFGQVPDWLREMPETTVQGFWGLMRDFYLAETKVPNKYKELIGIAVSGATRCKYCTLFHSEAARLWGATDDEIAEAAAMGGLTMMGSTFLNGNQVDYDRFRQQTLEMLEYARTHPVGPPPARAPAHA
jgi:AhpD family alkylhydroperoxidase